jgi:protein TonB
MRALAFLFFMPFFAFSQVGKGALWPGCELEDSTYQLDCSGEKMLDFILENQRIPKELDSSSIVQIRITIDTSGKVVRPKIIQSGGEKCDQEALRLVNSMPKWIPGTDSEGQKIPIKYTIPIHFIVKKDD